MNLFEKIVEVRKVAKGFRKDGKGYNYQYVTGDQVLSKIRDKMNELNLLLIPSAKLGEHHIHSYTTGKGKDALDFIVSGEMSYTWINADNPDEVLKVDWAYYGQMDEISRAYGSALTYSERYFLLKCLGLPTDEDDPDAKESNSPDQQTPQEQINGAISSKQIGRLFAIAKSAGVDEATARGHIVKKFTKQVDQLTKQEYDAVCEGYEILAKSKKTD